MNEKDITEMTRKEFEELKHRGWDEEIICDSIIILPGRSRDLHDSGFRSMDFVAVKDSKPICLLSGCSDVIHIDGIGGSGFREESFFNDAAWSIDCLPKSGLLRLWSTKTKTLKPGPSLSSFDIIAIREK